MDISNHHSGRGQDHSQVAGKSPRDAVLYVWSERIAMISGVGFVVALGITVLLPLLQLLHGSGFGFAHYMLGIVIIPSPFLLVLLVSGWWHRRISRRYRL